MEVQILGARSMEREKAFGVRGMHSGDALDFGAGTTRSSTSLGHGKLLANTGLRVDGRLQPEGPYRE